MPLPSSFSRHAQSAGAPLASPDVLLAKARLLETLVRGIAAAEVLPRYLNVSRGRKADGTLFTEADLATQRRLIEVLPTLLPGPVLGEEMSGEMQARLWNTGRSGLWCIDPIDGTTNFINGIPFFAISIAWLVDHEPCLGVVYNPISEECFLAAKGAGAFLNDEVLPLRRTTRRLREAVAGFDLKQVSPHLADELVTRPPYYSQRNFGSSTLEWCFLAAGRFDVYMHGGQMLWDYAPGKLILAEAGGQACSLDGDTLSAGPAVKRGVIAAANPLLFAEWRAWLQSHS
jgi:3'(2'), 5'-bisphosphate nucleotidase/myo-inositol-1(or 4)-monophosphatase